MAQFNLSSIGARGLVIFYKEQYFYVAEAKWRTLATEKPPEAPIANLMKLNAAMAALEDQVFVNLDSFGKNVDAPEFNQKPGVQQLAPKPGPNGAPAIMVCEDQKLYRVTPKDWTLLEPAGAEGDARVLVNRGAVLAAIPQNAIPFGTWCVLVNLASVITD